MERRQERHGEELEVQRPIWGGTVKHRWDWKWKLREMLRKGLETHRVELVRDGKT